MNLAYLALVALQDGYRPWHKQQAPLPRSPPGQLAAVDHSRLTWEEYAGRL
jgi:hypothetical protein